MIDPLIDMSGFARRVIAPSLLFTLLCFVLILMSHFWNRKKFDRKKFFIGIICLLGALVMLAENVNVAFNPHIAVYEGWFDRAYTHRGRWTYVFDEGDAPKEFFYLGRTEKKRIWPTDFEDGQMYRIYYEEKTKCIVYVDEITFFTK